MNRMIFKAIVYITIILIIMLLLILNVTTKDTPWNYPVEKK